MEALVFDLGGVLVGQSTQVARAAKRLGVPEEALRPLYWRHRDAWDRGWSNQEYWGAVAADLGIAMDDALADELARADADTWCRLRPAARQLLVELAEHPTPVWVLSNAASVFVEAIAGSDWRELVDGAFVSGALGMVKPHVDVYAHVEQELGVDPARIAFVDDRPENLEVPADRGWSTHLFSSDEDTRRWLEELGALPRA